MSDDEVIENLDFLLSYPVVKEANDFEVIENLDQVESLSEEESSDKAEVPDEPS